MKKMTKDSDPPRIRAEYDFSAGVRGKYAERFAAGSNVVVLDPDVAEAFPNSETVNRALRALKDVAQRHAGKSPG